MSSFDVHYLTQFFFFSNIALNCNLCKFVNLKHAIKIFILFKRNVNSLMHLFIIASIQQLHSEFELKCVAFDRLFCTYFGHRWSNEKFSFILTLTKHHSIWFSYMIPVDLQQRRTPSSVQNMLNSSFKGC